MCEEEAWGGTSSCIVKMEERERGRIGRGWGRRCLMRIEMMNERSLPLLQPNPNPKILGPRTFLPSCLINLPRADLASQLRPRQERVFESQGVTPAIKVLGFTHSQVLHSAVPSCVSSTLLSGTFNRIYFQ